METERCVGVNVHLVCLYLNVYITGVWWSWRADTDLLGEEGHDGEDDERHQDAVGPELQLVPIHPPDKRADRHQMYASPLSARSARWL